MKKYTITFMTHAGNKIIVESDTTPDTKYDTNLRTAIFTVGWHGTMIAASDVLFVEVKENEQPKVE